MAIQKGAVVLVDAVVLFVVGLLAILLPASGSYRSRLTISLQRRARARVPVEQRRALEARMVRRARGAGAGIVLAGAAALLADRAWAGAHEMAGGPFVLSLVLIGGAAGLAVVEIWRPGAVPEGPRAARLASPRRGDYLPERVRLLCRVVTGLGLLALVATLALARTAWFDAATIVRSPVPVLAGAVGVLAVLFGLAVRRVLDAPQPARNSSELYWQDAVRAQTLSLLVVPTPVVSLLGMLVLGAVLDDAASVTAVATGSVGPDWTLAVLVVAYALPVALVAGVLLVAAHPRGTGRMRHFRERLWADRPPGVAPGQVG